MMWNILYNSACNRLNLKYAVRRIQDWLQHNNFHSSDLRFSSWSAYRYGSFYSHNTRYLVNKSALQILPGRARTFEIPNQYLIGTLRNNSHSSGNGSGNVQTKVKEKIIGTSPTQAKPLTKKRIIKRKQSASTINEVVNEQGQPIWYPVVAYATCEEINLKKLRTGLISEGLYIPTVWPADSELDDVIHVTAKYVVGNEPREMFFFGDGAVVFWNVPESERSTVLRSMKKFEVHSFEDSEVLQESEYIHYSHIDQRPTYLSNGKLLLNRDCLDLVLEKYTVANAMAQSVKLGIWESTMEKFVTSIDHITEELKLAKHIKLTRAQVLQKTGEIFALRNEINLNSDLLDIPDFYWEHENLEALYRKMHNYLSITRRTEVMNEKLTQCYELLELISGHLNDKHHVRLEWMIIALITVEVVFEILHVIDRYQLL